MSPFPSIHFQKEVILGQVIVSNFLNLPDLSTDKNQAKNHLLIHARKKFVRELAKT
jgi:hypothetical protein